MTDNSNGADNALEFLRARLLWRRAELSRVGALERLLDEVLSPNSTRQRTKNGRLLKLSAASRLCGYSPDHLRVLIKAGKLPSHGRPHAPLVRCRNELPRKPGRSVAVLTSARAVANLKAQIRAERHSCKRKEAEWHSRVGLARVLDHGREREDPGPGIRPRLAL